MGFHVAIRLPTATLGYFESEIVSESEAIVIPFEVWSGIP